MKKITFKTLLVAVGLLVSASTWASLKTVASWDFAARQSEVANKTVVSYSSTTVTIGTGCNLGTGFEEGLAFQGADKWFYYTSGGLYNGNSGGRVLGILSLKAGDVITVTGNDTFSAGSNVTSTTSNVFSVTADGNAGISVGRNKTVTSIVVTREVSDDTCADPTYTISGVSGTSRKFTLSCDNDDATIYYSETEKTTSDDGWSTYTSEVTTSAATIWAYAKTSAATSNVINFTTGAGTAITLNAPIITKTSYNNGSYTVEISSNQSDLAIIPSSVSYYYAIDGGTDNEYSTPVALAAGSTITAYAISAGYTNSDNANLTAVARPAFAAVWSIDFAGQASADKGSVTVSEVAFTANENDFGTITSDGLTSNDNFGVKTGTSWLLRNTSNKGLYSMNGGSTPIGFANVTDGQYIIIKCKNQAGEFKSSNGADNTALSTNSEIILQANADGNVYVNLGRYIYIQSVEVADVATSVNAVVGSDKWATYVAPYALDFSGVTGLTAYTATTDGSTVTLTPVDDVQAGTAVVLKADAADTYSIPTITASTTDKGGLTSGAVADVTADTEHVYYGLAMIGGKAKFAKIATGAIADGKAYFKLNATSPAREILDIDGETTGIESVKAAAENGVIYNLQGVRVAQPTKGLYIMDGKKMVIK